MSKTYHIHFVNREEPVTLTIYDPNTTPQKEVAKWNDPTFPVENIVAIQEVPLD